MEEPTAFMTLETLKTLMGQVTAVVLATQAVKSAVPRLANYWIRLVAVMVGIGVQLGLGWQSEMPPSSWVLASLNGTLVAMVAMKSAEFLKGSSVSPSPKKEEP